MRPCLPIPSTYPGHMSTKTCHVSTLQQVVHESLDELAAKLRTTVNPGALRENMLVEAKSLASRSRKGERRSEVDQREVLVVSSWAKVDC